MLIHSNLSECRHNYLVAILAKVVFCSLEDWQIELRNGVNGYIRVSFRQMVDKHSTPLKTQQAFVALVNEPVVIRR